MFVHLSTHTRGGPDMVSDALDLKPQVVVSHNWMLGIDPKSTALAKKAPNCVATNAVHLK